MLKVIKGKLYAPCACTVITYLFSPGKKNNDHQLRSGTQIAKSKIRSDTMNSLGLTWQKYIHITISIDDYHKLNGSYFCLNIRHRSSTFWGKWNWWGERNWSVVYGIWTSEPVVLDFWYRYNKRQCILFVWSDKQTANGNDQTPQNQSLNSTNASTIFPLAPNKPAINVICGINEQLGPPHTSAR
jgi:hypothetical protein